ncbi:Histone-lysine N-methyltransferase 2D [Amphibalanus amphitrite]|uniref:Histone-lysine N-methyltransferase 2D n=1 Tax=Amphibalanus amphitrite TaxID=1232801 RepID=A0A6A4VFX6_AMPAM|nr:Histone-lysine N-methyltransferase 2D [Amphibalanus amphitrite]
MRAERDLVREAQERRETEERLQQEQEASSKELAAGTGAGGDAKSDKLNETDDDGEDALNDIFPGLGADLEGDLVDTILNEDENALGEHPDLEDIADSELANMSGDDAEGGASKDELSELLDGPWPESFESMVTGLPNMDGQDVEDLLKDTLEVTPQQVAAQHQHQQQQRQAQLAQQRQLQLAQQQQQQQQQQQAEQARPALPPPPGMPPPAQQLQLIRAPLQHPQQPLGAAVRFRAPPPQQQAMVAGAGPAPLPHMAQFGQEHGGQFGEFADRPQSGEMAWTGAGAVARPVAGASGTQPPPGATSESQTYNQRNLAKWEHDMSLGEAATISPVLYANHKHPELLTEFPAVADRVRQIMKIWRALSPESKQPYLQKAKDNRSASKVSSVVWRARAENLARLYAPRCVGFAEHPSACGVPGALTSCVCCDGDLPARRSGAGCLSAARRQCVCGLTDRPGSEDLSGRAAVTRPAACLCGTGRRAPPVPALAVRCQ